jgi:hypothetical protein
MTRGSPHRIESLRLGPNDQQTPEDRDGAGIDRADAKTRTLLRGAVRTHVYQEALANVEAETSFCSATPAVMAG